MPWVGLRSSIVACPGHTNLVYSKSGGGGGSRPEKHGPEFLAPSGRLFENWGGGGSRPKKRGPEFSAPLAGFFLYQKPCQRG